MQLRILLFAGLRDAAGAEFIDVELDTVAPGSVVTAQDVLQAIGDRLPSVVELVRVSRLAVDGAYVGLDFTLSRPDSEYALIPPVSGG